MKKYLVILIAAVTYFAYSPKLSAQEAFAGGELSARYVGDGTELCGDPLPYVFTLRLFRDDPGPGGVDFPTTRAISVYKNPTGVLMYPNRVTGADIVLDNYTPISTVPTPCIFASTALTDGGIYESAPILLDADERYEMIFSEETPNVVPNYTVGYEFNSPNNNNIRSGVTFKLSGRIQTTGCSVLVTDNDDTPANEKVEINYGRNSMPQWITNGTFEIVQSLCDGNAYEFNLYNYVVDSDVTTYSFEGQDGNIETETVTDEIEIDILDVQSGWPVGVTSNIYASPELNGLEPFPTKKDDRFTYDRVTGVLTFTPDLPTGQTFYTAAITLRIGEYRKGYRLEPGGGAGGTDFVRTAYRQFLGFTDRQVRFVIGDETFCNKSLPTVISEKRNVADDAWEFGCQSDTLFFSFDNNGDGITDGDDIGMLLNTISTEAPYDIRIQRGIDPLVPLEESTVAIKEIYVDPANVNTLGEFTEFAVVLKEGIGPGRYVMFFKNGQDGDTWGNLCGEFKPDLAEPEFANEEHVIFTVNEIYENYVFREDDDPRVGGSQKDFCYPSDEDGFFIDALYKQSEDVIERADLFIFQYRGPFSPQAPPQLTVTQTLSGDGAVYDAFPTITVPADYNFPTVPLITPTKGFWTIGIGLRYTHSFEGNTIVNRCFGESFTEVDYVEHPRVRTADIDLCIDEEFPVIKDMVDEQFRVYKPIGPFSPTNYSWERRFLENDRKTPAGPFTSVGGQSDPNDVIAGDTIPKDSLILEGAAALGINRINQIRLRVTFPNECVSENVITVIKQRVEVDIQEVPLKLDRPTKDSIICQGQEFQLSNSKGDLYYRPEYMSRQWYFNNQILEDDTTDVLPRAQMIRNGRGWYKLVVTKTTENSICFGADSVFINLADNLEPTDPGCSIVTFQDGDIRQRFFWPVVQGADNYEVRPVDEDENPLDNDGNRISEVEWYEANDTYGIHHWTKGKEVRLYVRAVNNEVEEGAPCKYGEASLAEACEVLVRPVNIFTPNGDGINDFLRFDLLEVFVGSELVVYNRWGKEMFRSSNYQNNWDGGDLKDGTYFYVLDIDDPSGMQDIFKGTFTIVR